MKRYSIRRPRWHDTIQSHKLMREGESESVCSFMLRRDAEAVLSQLAAAYDAAALAPRLTASLDHIITRHREGRTVATELQHLRALLRTLESVLTLETETASETAAAEVRRG